MSAAATAPRVLDDRATGSIRARRHLLAILAFWAWQMALATLVAWPVSAAVGSVFSTSPDGDAVLWEPGGAALVRLTSREDPVWSMATTLFVTFLLASALLDLVPVGALYARLARRTRGRLASGVADIGESIHALPAFATLLAGTLAIQLALVVAAGWLGIRTSHGLIDSMGKPRGDLVAMAVVGILLCFVTGASLLHDVARAAAILRGLSALRAVRAALRVFATERGSLVWSWAWRQLVGVGWVALAALVASSLGGRGGVALIGLGVVHQGALLARTGLRVSWMARALRAVNAQEIR